MPTSYSVDLVIHDVVNVERRERKHEKSEHNEAFIATVLSFQTKDENGAESLVEVKLFSREPLRIVTRP